MIRSLTNASMRWLRRSNTPLRRRFFSKAHGPAQRRVPPIRHSSLVVGGCLVATAAFGLSQAAALSQSKESTEEREEGEDEQATSVGTGALWTVFTGVYTGPMNPENLENVRIFSGNSNRALAEEVCSYLGAPLNKAQVTRFQDGESSIRIIESVRDKDVIIIQPTCKPVNDSMIDLLLMISAMKRAAARSITAVLPYYGYARSDVKMCSRIPISAADVALMLETMGVDRIIAMDLHHGQIQGFFNIPVDNLTSVYAGAAYFSGKKLDNPVVVSPDAGGVSRATTFRDCLAQQGHPTAEVAMLIEQDTRKIAGQRRQQYEATEDALRGSEEVWGEIDLVGEVKGKDCIIVEDIVDTAYQVCRCAEELKQKGAKSVMVYSAHGVFAEDSSARLNDSPITEIVVSNSIPLSAEASHNKKIVRLSVAPLLSEAIKNTLTHKSLSESLFNLPAQNDKKKN